MSDTKTQATAPTAAPTAPAGAAAPATGGQVDLTVQDLNTLRTVIDVATTRGAFKANEMLSVGTVYNKLEAFLNAVSQNQPKEPSEGAK